MKNKLKIEIDNEKRIIKLFKTFKINIYNISYKNNKIMLIVNRSDLIKISKLTKYKIIREYGIYNFKNNILKEKRSIILVILFLISSLIISQLTVNINIISENKKIISTIKEELEDYNLKEYTFQATKEKLNNIKQKIKKHNKDSIEWINIKKNGMTYQINIEEKVVANKKENKNNCNIIATQEGTITKIETKKGTVLVEQNEHVNKGDILISGETYFNEELKKVECATGDVYAKTWYSINLSIPKDYKKIKPTKKYRYNIYIKRNNKTIKIFKTRVKNATTSSKITLNIFNYKIQIIKEYESTLEKTKYTEKETEHKINKLIKSKMIKLLKKDGKIIEQKVLKKNEFNSTIEVEIFIIAEEKISTQKNIVKEEET